MTASGALLHEEDTVRPFMLEQSALRGRLARLGPAVDTILTRHDYPHIVGTQLGELLALAAVLSTALKFTGTFTLQTKGDGPVGLMVADVTSEGALRGYAQFDVDEVAELETAALAGRPSVPRILGAGYLALTVDQGDHTERYQGIVELTGASLADCIHHYFRQSQQIDVGIMLAAARLGGTAGEDAAWRCGALMVERLAEEGGLLGQGADAGGSEDDWRTAVALMSSCTAAELLHPALPGDSLLYRLFHEGGVRVFERKQLAFGCRCSADRVSMVLRQLPEEDVRDLAVDGEVVATCEFCNETYRFDASVLDA
jgi:molecular chaperone Hsp33